MPQVITRPELEQQAYTVRFHVRTPARTKPDELDQRLRWSLERTIRGLSRHGWHFVRLSDQPPRGPLPVVPVKGFGKRPVKIKRKAGQASAPEPPDDSLWRVSTLPSFGPRAAHLVTDEVDWEYAAIFHRPTIPTEYLKEQGEPAPAWLNH
jgi:hypothetical protein